MYNLHIIKAIKRMSLSKIRGFIFEIYYKRIGFSDESSYYSMKRLKKKIYGCSLTNYQLLKNITNHL